MIRTLLALAWISGAAFAAPNRHWHALDSDSSRTLHGYGVEAMGTDPDPAMLVCRCNGESLELFVIADTSWVGPGKTPLVTISFDGQTPRRDRWTTSTDGGALFASEPRSLVRRMMNAKVLSLVGGSDGDTLRFEVGGFGESLDAILTSCTLDGGYVGDEDAAWVDALPEAIQKVPPDYPQEARDAKMQGTVVVRTLISTDGRVREAHAERSVPVLDQAAEAAVRKWTFKPAMAGGKPVDCWMRIPIKFSLH